MPASSATCKSAVKVDDRAPDPVLRASASTRACASSFRWPRGALATKLDHTRVGYVARVPPGTTRRDRLGDRQRRAGPALERIQDHGRAPPPAPAPRRPRRPAAGGLPGQRHVDLGAAQEPTAATSPRSPPARTPRGCRPCSLRAPTARRSRWAQFNPALVAGAARQRAARLRLAVRLRRRPAGRGGARRDAVADGADCLVIDAETQYEGKYARPSSTWPRCGPRSARPTRSG